MELQIFSSFAHNLGWVEYLTYSKKGLEKDLGMNRLLLILIAVIGVVSIAGCYKDVQREQRTDILINHTWYLKGLWIGGSSKTDSCYLSEVLTFKKDSLGNHHYKLLCDAS